MRVFLHAPACVAAGNQLLQSFGMLAIPEPVSITPTIRLASTPPSAAEVPMLALQLLAGGAAQNIKTLQQGESWLFTLAVSSYDFGRQSGHFFSWVISGFMHIDPS